MKKLTIFLLFAVAMIAAIAAFYGLSETGALRPFLAALRPQAEYVVTLAAAAPDAKAERRILYYRNPMGLADTSPQPKKDWMGMDYIPVYEGEAQESGSSVRVTPEKIQRLGIRTEAVSRRSLSRPIHAFGTIAFDERRLAVFSAKFDGWIEKLHVNASGSAVKKNDRLMDVYSPELVQAQQDYIAARDGTNVSTRPVAELALRRLRNFDAPDDLIQKLLRQPAPDRIVGLRAPIAGIVIEKMAVEGMHFAAGDPLFRFADMSQLWLIAEIFEQDLSQVTPGAEAKATVSAYPGRVFTGRVDLIYPTLSRETRTARVRIEIPNPQGALKPEMYAAVEIAGPTGKPDALTVPASALLDSGTRQTVLVDRGDGRFEPRAVQAGARADGQVEILDGLTGDERVVVSANFLIDAESNLQAVLRSFTAPDPKIPGHGVVTAFLPDQRQITIDHEPIAALSWPRMNMEFGVAEGVPLNGIAVGGTVRFMLKPAADGAYIVDSLEPVTPGTAR